MALGKTDRRDDGAVEPEAGRRVLEATSSVIGGSEGLGRRRRAREVVVCWESA